MAVKISRKYFLEGNVMISVNMSNSYYHFIIIYMKRACLAFKMHKYINK